MRRLVGLLLAHSLVVSSAMATSMHVHDYAEHDHPDHHHGPASHEHERSAPADQDHASPAEDEDHSALQAQSCDAGRHAVAVRSGSAKVQQAHLDLGELPGPTLIGPAAPIRSATAVVDVRVHGPPFDVRIPARAPPLPHLA